VAPTDSSHALHAALVRIAGKPLRRARHGLIYRMVVTSCDGVRCAVQFGPISDHRPRPSTATLNQLADLLRVERDALETTLSMTALEVEAHLARHTAEQLKPPAHSFHRAPGS